MEMANSNLRSEKGRLSGLIAAHWRLFLAQGVCQLLLGVVAISLPVLATLAVELYTGWMFAISGVVGLIAMLSLRNTSAFFWVLLSAIASLAVAYLLLTRPEQGAMTLTLILSGFFLVQGLFQVAASLPHRNLPASQWIWLLLSGLADLFLAGFIWSNWPSSAAWVLGLFAGISLITSGIACILTALASHRMAQGKV